MINFAEEITSRINMEDIFAEYGFVPNRAGFITCPFHSEKTASLKMYADRQKFKCFGCGEGGSVIDFVMKLFNLKYMQAVIRINEDFNLNLPLKRKMSIREARAAQEAREERLRKNQNRSVRDYERSCMYADLIGCYLLTEQIIHDNKPADGEEWGETFARAVRLKSIVNSELDNFNYGRR